MELKCYLQGTEVRKVVFKTFSSACEQWILLLDRNTREHSPTPGIIRLYYHPETNSVEMQHEGPLNPEILKQYKSASVTSEPATNTGSPRADRSNVPA